jgi:hypothetical protein
MEMQASQVMTKSACLVASGPSSGVIAATTKRSGKIEKGPNLLGGFQKREQQRM